MMKLDSPWQFKPVLLMAVDRLADYNSSLCTLEHPGSRDSAHVCTKCLPIVWDFAEINPFSRKPDANWMTGFETILATIETERAPRIPVT